jgi:hypothetical protein
VLVFVVVNVAVEVWDTDDDSLNDADDDNEFSDEILLVLDGKFDKVPKFVIDPDPEKEGDGVAL